MVMKKKTSQKFVFGLKRSFKAVNKQLRVSIDLIIVVLRLCFTQRHILLLLMLLLLGFNRTYLIDIHGSM